MARLLLVAAVALAVAPVGTASRRAANCASSQLRVSVQTQGVNTTAWIGVTVRNDGARCALRGSIRLTIERAGRRLAAHGNPLAIPARGVVGSRLFTADWSNWCGPRAGLRLLVSYAGRTLRTRLNVLPVCLDRRQPSKLLRGGTD